MNRFASIPVVLLILSLIAVILFLLALPPPNAPPFERLTESTCDPFPASRVFLRNNTIFTCRASDGTVRKVNGFSGGFNARALIACRRAGAAIKVWLNPAPSPYGPYVFQASSQSGIFLSYPDAASTYESKRAFSQILAWSLLGLGAVAFGVVATRGRKHRSVLRG